MEEQSPPLIAVRRPTWKPDDVRLMDSLVLRYKVEASPFFTYILGSVRRVATDELDTMGVCFDKRADTFEMAYNPSWVRETFEQGEAREKGLGAAWILNVIQHEMYHIVLKHVTARVREPAEAWNIATDLAINWLITHGDASFLPPGGLIPTQRQVKPDGSPIVRGVDPDFACDVAQACEELPGGLSSEIYFESLMRALGDEFKKRQEQADAASGGAGKPGETIDQHGKWSAAANSPEEAEYAAQRLGEIVRQATIKAEQSSSGWGSAPAWLRELLKKLVFGQVDWRALLRQWVTGRFRGERHSTIRKLNPRYPYIAPGSKRSRRPHLLVAIDMSGSVGNDDVALAFSELDGLAKFTAFSVTHFDTECDPPQLRGRGSRLEAKRTRCGGTDFDAPIGLANGSRGTYDGVIIITDGCAAVPQVSRLPLVWLITPGQKLCFPHRGNETVISLSRERVYGASDALG